MVKDQLKRGGRHDGVLAFWCWKPYSWAAGVLGSPTDFAGPGPYVVSRKRYLASDQHMLLKFTKLFLDMNIISYEFYEFFSDLAGKICGVVFSPNLHIPSKSNHWIRRATLARCKNASLLRQGTPCPQGTWSERGGITSVLDCKNCDERREMGPIGFVRSPMVDYLRSLRQNPY